MIRDRADAVLKERGQQRLSDDEWQVVLGFGWIAGSEFSGLEGTQEGLAETAEDVVDRVLEWRSLPRREVPAVRP
ncbi:MAG: hypothetical protein WCP21_16520, partial [Armatimonadota bacterium]